MSANVAGTPEHADVRDGEGSGDPSDRGIDATAGLRVRIALAVGFALLAVALVFTLSQSPAKVIWSNYAPLRGNILTTESGGASACQTPVPLPAGATAVRISLYDSEGPRVAVSVLSGGRVLTSGVRGAGWIGEPLTIPVPPVAHAVANTKLCFALGAPAGVVAVEGSTTSGREALVIPHAHRLRVRVEYLRPGSGSWWSRATSIARRMGLGRWPTGTWLALLVAAMIAAVGVGAGWLALRELA